MGAAALALLAIPGLGRAEPQPGTTTTTTTHRTTTTTTPAQPATPPQESPSATAARVGAKPAVDPDAIAALNRMGAFLRSQSSMKINAEMSTDDVLDSGQKVQVASTVELDVRRPDRLRANIITDQKNEQLFYDGKSFTIYQPMLGYYAQFKAPATVNELVDMAEQRYGVDMPLADLFHWGSGESRAGEIRSATRVGVSTVKGAKCDHYAFRQADVDWEICIQQGSQPLPLKLVITTSTEPTQPQRVAVMTWQLSPAFDERVFEFIPPPNAHRIDFDVSSPGRMP
jgi:hypothetical protein